MTIETLAEKFRLKIARDECGDKIIEGRHSHIYTDAGKVCGVWLNARVNQPKLAPLGGKLWVGDCYMEGHRRFRDAKVTGVPPERWPLLIRLTGCKKKRVMSEAQAAVLARAAAASPIGRKQPKD